MCRCFRLYRLNRCHRFEGLSLKASAAVRLGGRIGTAEVIAGIVAVACTNSTVALVPRVCPSGLRQPYGWAEELVRLARLLASVYSHESIQSLHSSRGTVPQGFGVRTAGRQNWCDRRDCLRRCIRMNRFNRCTRPEGLSLTTPATVRRGGRIGATSATA